MIGFARSETTIESTEKEKMEQMKTYTDYIGGEICIGYTIGKGADGEREIQEQSFCIATFSPKTPYDAKDVISIMLDEFRDKSGRTIGDLLAEHGQDVVKIMDESE